MVGREGEGEREGGKGGKVGREEERRVRRMKIWWEGGAVDGILQKTKSLPRQNN